MPGAFLTGDIDGILRTDEFAEAVLVTSGDYAGETLKAIYDTPFSDPLGVAGADPLLVTASIPELTMGDTVEFAGKVYRLRVPEPDGTGITRYPLTEV